MGMDINNARSESKYVPEWIQEASQELISDEQFNKHIKFDKDFVEKNYFEEERSKELMPMLSIHGREGDMRTGERANIACALAEFPDDINKHQLFQKIGVKIAQEFPGIKVGAITFLTEAWMKIIKKEESLPNHRISHDPDRIEITAITGITIDGREASLIYRIERDKEGYVSKLKPQWERFYDPNNSGKEGLSAEHNLLESFFKGYMGEARSRLIKRGEKG